MPAKKKLINRRHDKRFRVKDGILALIVSDSEKQLGQITDISNGGLAFRYMASEALCRQPFTLDIFITGNGIYMKRVPFKTISDFSIISKLPFICIPKRRHSIQFSKLTFKQLSQVEYFIQNHTVDEAQKI